MYVCMYGNLPDRKHWSSLLHNIRQGKCKSLNEVLFVCMYVCMYVCVPIHGVHLTIVTSSHTGTIVKAVKQIEVPHLIHHLAVVRYILSCTVCMYVCMYVCIYVCMCK